MNYDKYDIFRCKRCFYLFICNELSCIDQGNQLLITSNTMNIITNLQPSNFNVFLHGYFYSVSLNINMKTCSLRRALHRCHWSWKWTRWQIFMNSTTNYQGKNSRWFRELNRKCENNFLDYHLHQNYHYHH